MDTRPMYTPGLKDPEEYDIEVTTLVQKTQRANKPLAVELHNYADALYLDKFAEAMESEDWHYRINSLTLHHLKVMSYAPDDSLFLAAQMKALELGNIPAVQELYVNNLMAVSGKYKNPDINKLSNRFDERDLKRTLVNAKALMARWEQDKEGLALAVEEFLGVPTGLNECISFAAKQLLLREKSLVSTIEKVSKQKLRNNNEQNIVAIRFVSALAKKRFLVAASMRELIRIKTLKSEEEIRKAVGLFAGTFVRARFTNKLADELLVFLEGYEPLSPTWFYFHMQLDKCMMQLDFLPSYTDLSRQIQAQVFFENVLFARVILALRGESAEPYKTYLPTLAFDQAKSPVLMAASSNGSCLDSKIEVYQRLFDQKTLTAKLTSIFLTQNLTKGIEACANETGYRNCLPLNFIEFEKLSSTEKIQSLADDWFMDLSEPEPRKEKIGKKQRNPPKMKIVDVETNEVLKSVGESSPDSSDSLPELEFEKESKDPVLPEEQDVEPEDIEGYLAEHQAEVSKFQAMKSMQKFQFDALRDASKSLGVADSPKQMNSRKTSVVFFSTDDFLALHPEATHVYQENIYSELANTALTQPKIKLQWIFSKDVIINQDTFIFLCQVFNLVEGRSKLTFPNFIKAVDDLTNPSIASKKQPTKKPNRTVFRFSHAFVINGEVCLPPIGGVHREHASSRFNYKQVKKFLMHGGAHPYFFRVIT